MGTQLKVFDYKTIIMSQVENFLSFTEVFPEAKNRNINHFSAAQWRFSETSFGSTNTNVSDRSLSVSIFQPPHTKITMPMVTVTPA